MEGIVLDENFKAIAIVDSFNSFIWTDRFYKAGDFEIYTAVDMDALNTIYKPDYYLWMKNSEHLMIIEGSQIDSDVEKGNYMTISGRSLESILERRIIWGQMTFSGTLQTQVKAMLDSCIISPTITDRKIPNFIFQESTDPAITSITLADTQYNGENLYDAICKLCESNKVGFKIILNDSNQFVFSLYKGTDRSYDQDANPYVIFSPKFENIINSKYIKSQKTLKNVTLVAGEGQGSDQKTTVVGSGNGLSRRELYTSSTGVSSTTSGGTLSDAEYMQQLSAKGTEALSLSSNMVTTSFEGEVETTVLFKYNEDFFIGDTVQIANEYGMEESGRVSEVVMSQDSSKGYTVVPTFDFNKDNTAAIA
jgi:hypothetical protein